jgi:hypothetical protein
MSGLAAGIAGSAGLAADSVGDRNTGGAGGDSVAGSAATACLAVAVAEGSASGIGFAGGGGTVTFGSPEAIAGSRGATTAAGGDKTTFSSRDGGGGGAADGGRGETMAELTGPDGALAVERTAAGGVATAVSGASGFLSIAAF